jgi:hypothetical protein
VGDFEFGIRVLYLFDIPLLLMLCFVKLIQFQLNVKYFFNYLRSHDPNQTLKHSINSNLIVKIWTVAAQLIAKTLFSSVK